MVLTSKMARIRSFGIHVHGGSHTSYGIHEQDGSHVIFGSHGPNGCTLVLVLADEMAHTYSVVSAGVLALICLLVLAESLDR